MIDMFIEFGNALAKRFMYILLVMSVFAILGTWKLVEIIIWLCS